MLAFFVLTQYRRVPVCQTDRRTDARTRCSRNMCRPIVFILLIIQIEQYICLIPDTSQHHFYPTVSYDVIHSVQCWVRIWLNSGLNVYHTDPLIAAMLLRRPTFFAQVTRRRFRKPFFRPAETKASWIFSQTRGTPNKTVGRTSVNVVLNVPCHHHTLHYITLQ